MRIREAREDDADAIARVFIDSRRAAHWDQLPHEGLLRFTYEESARNWARALREIGSTASSADCIEVAENDAGMVVGVAMGVPAQPHHPNVVGSQGSPLPSADGEVNVLYLLPAFQRQGMGRRLVATVARRLYDRGARSLLIRVLAINAPARRFYEALGGELAPELEEQIDEDGTQLDLLAYTWPDIRTVLDPKGKGGA